MTKTRKPRRMRTFDEKLAIIQSVEDQRQKGKSLAPVLKRYAVSSAQVSQWKAQRLEGTLREKSVTAKGRTRKAYKRELKPRGAGAELILKVDRALKERDTYRDALMAVRAELKTAQGRCF